MSDIQCVIIDFQNLTEEEQLHLWRDLFDFAHDKLPAERMLNCFIVEGKK